MIATEAGDQRGPPARGRQPLPAASVVLDPRGQVARAGRAFVAEQLIARQAPTFADDAVLVTAELVANALQHGRPPVTVTVTGDAGCLRVAVTDTSTRIPVRPTPSTSNMTGRGIALVEALARRWGVEHNDHGPGKTVWAEFSNASSGDDLADEALEAILDRWLDDGGDGSQKRDATRYTVVLGDVPTDLLIEAKAHIDNLVREFSLAAAAGQADTTELPVHLARLIETVVHGFSDARDVIKRQALAAARHGEPRTRLVLSLPASAAAAGEAYLAALDEADDYARAARLLTLETPADHRLFRRWYVEAVIHQLRELASGRTPDPVPPFEDRLISEVRRLSSVERVSERAIRLQRVTAALARTTTPQDVASVVLAQGVEVLDASGGGMLVPAGDGEHLAVPGVVGYGEELVGQLREERADAELPAATALRTGQPVWLETPQERDREFPALRGFEASTVAMCAIPLVVGDRTLGALRFSFDKRKLFDEDEREFVLALAAQTAQTLQRTESYEAERKASLALQRALLPARIPAVTGWAVAAYYSPAGQQEAGGDFYDVLPVSGGRTVAVVGDVMGRGVDAAAAMAQIRSTIRAYAIDDPDPTSVFERVDAFFDSLDAGQFVTALYFLIEPDGGTVHVANAGHLAPLLVDADGSVVIATAHGTPFGVGRGPRPSTSVTVPRGASLVAITDGLVERRGEDIDEGIARILLAARGGRDADGLLDQIITSAAQSRAHDDDVTVLVLRRD